MLDENEKQQVKELCERIAKEQDHHQFSMLIAQLNQLLEQSEVRTDTARNNLSHSSKMSSRPNLLEVPSAKGHPGEVPNAVPHVRHCL